MYKALDDIGRTTMVNLMATVNIKNTIVQIWGSCVDRITIFCAFNVPILQVIMIPTILIALMIRDN